jgi:hypothetical protein
MSHEARWRAAGYHKLTLTSNKLCIIHPSTQLIDGSIILEVRWNLSYHGNLVLLSGAGTISCRATYIFGVDGSIKVTFVLDLPSYFPTCPRFGVKFGMPCDKYELVRWLGLGPHESYCDRKSCAYLDTFESKISDLHTPYIYPQESGSRVEPR